MDNKLAVQPAAHLPMPGLSGTPNGPVGKSLFPFLAPEFPQRLCLAQALTTMQEISSREPSTRTETSRTHLLRLESSLTLKRRFTSRRESGVIFWLGFINSSRRNTFALPGDAHLGIWTSCHGVVFHLGEIAFALLTFTFDFCIGGPKGFALGSVALDLATFV